MSILLCVSSEFAASTTELRSAVFGEGSKPMNHVVDVAGVGGAIAFSIAFGVCFGWLGLRGLMLLLPRTAAVVGMEKSAARNHRQGTKAA